MNNKLTCFYDFAAGCTMFITDDNGVTKKLEFPTLDGASIVNHIAEVIKTYNCTEVKVNTFYKGLERAVNDKLNLDFNYKDYINFEVFKV